MPGPGRLLRAVTDALPNVTGIQVRRCWPRCRELLDQIGAALAATGALTLVAGALVLAGAVAAGQRRRIQEAVMLKTLGATRAQIRAAWLVEFGVLGAGRRAARRRGRHGGELRRGALLMHTSWVLPARTLAADGARRASR